MPTTRAIRGHQFDCLPLGGALFQKQLVQVLQTTYTFIHSRTHTRIPTLTLTRTLTHSHTHSYAYTYPYTHADIHTLTPVLTHSLLGTGVPVESGDLAEVKSWYRTCFWNLKLARVSWWRGMVRSKRWAQRGRCQPKFTFVPFAS